jgi:hypothetical protein
VSVTYEAVLDVSEDSVLWLSGLLHAERVRRGTRKGTRVLSTFKQAVLALRWFFDHTRMSALARDNKISVSTVYAYRDEAMRCWPHSNLRCTRRCWRRRRRGIRM